MARLNMAGLSTHKYKILIKGRSKVDPQVVINIAYGLLLSLMAYIWKQKEKESDKVESMVKDHNTKIQNNELAISKLKSQADFSKETISKLETELSDFRKDTQAEFKELYTHVSDMKNEILHAINRIGPPAGGSNNGG